MLQIPSLKNKTKKLGISTLPDPVDFYLPLDTYRGQMSPIVALGEKVLKYQPVAVSTSLGGSKLHAPVSGRVKEVLSINGKPCLHLQNDFEETVFRSQEVHGPTLSLTDFALLLAQFGIEGAGGSRFPTHLKYSLAGKAIDTLIFNGVECEPYLSADAALLMDKTTDLLLMAQFIAQLTQAKHIVFALEKHNSDIAVALRAAARCTKMVIKSVLCPIDIRKAGSFKL